MIKACSWSDCRGIEVEFDATKWAEYASDEMLIDLAKCGFRGDYAADDVVIFMADFDDQASRLFKFIELVPRQPFSGETNGFECEVDREDLTTWVESNRPNLLEQFLTTSLENE
jgi:hypothetical protein